MAGGIQLEVLTPSGRALEVETAEVTATGPLGEFGVLPGHTYLVTLIEPCTLRYAGGSIEVSAGVCRIGEDRMSVLVAAAGPGSAEVPSPFKLSDDTVTAEEEAH
jgi:F-type H+-transporting ATPase subunit epsilon